MARSDINDIQAFLMVAKERNFTRAAAKLGISQSSLSHTVRRLEARLGIRLLARTTRSVAPTEAGERLLLFVSPRLDEIEGELNALTALRTSPTGNLRISAVEHATNAVLLPRLNSFLAQYPDIKLEVHLDNALTDIIAQGYDAGVRLGEQVAKDMIAVRIGPDWRMAVVGAPTYFAKVPAPSNPHDLSAHNCINLRLLTYGGLYAWEFERDGRRLNVRVEGQLTFSSSRPILDAAIAGHGLACIPEDLAGPALASGQLARVMEEWCPTFVGYHLYYPNRRQPSPAFSLLVEALRYRG
ncbi:LysR family transcriptional regulator [Devosia epidermidihirudinis]|uniref:LysR family transcriptional regulator n=1 Tax=Devosia epidermidihirudinis TaxID=1293439 RepID=A0A0F5QIS9_9HYPH|nr:LysR family transcriptional regulator [Devosia epidermidihirudinis]KKC40902.1 LysR family transcriptional regulator [Devosia epidermidihirudinis]